MNARYTTMIAASLVLVVLLHLGQAQLGEVAGHYPLNVSLGGTASQSFTFINDGNSPIQFEVVLPSLNQIVNQTTPKLTAFPLSGSIPPHANLSVTITASMPSKDAVGMHWHGILQVIAVNNATNAGGAVIRAGVAKMIDIYSKKEGSNALIYAAGAAVVIIIAGSAYLLYRMGGKKSGHRVG